MVRGVGPNCGLVGSRIESDSKNTEYDGGKIETMEQKGANETKIEAEDKRIAD